MYRETDIIPETKKSEKDFNLSENKSFITSDNKKKNHEKNMYTIYGGSINKLWIPHCLPAPDIHGIRSRSPIHSGDNPGHRSKAGLKAHDQIPQLLRQPNLRRHPWSISPPHRTKRSPRPYIRTVPPNTANLGNTQPENCKKSDIAPRKDPNSNMPQRVRIEYAATSRPADSSQWTLTARFNSEGEPNAEEVTGGCFNGY
ncbi:hypothetical protein ASPTUDRAFT_938944 [Aspergillus tubingensis CBS 134.48]|uniref:Uncharacterized protein n=1 Tax=Aspergillus tubingensis (strain CBS 134.48) TaxID=767770 RepID=A0A1L9MRK6_ASPTC|nr:hypothetical protein ASPTUDRAFT_938944 [Aspergillus tubingensis CBS 134.48]